MLTALMLAVLAAAAAPPSEPIGGLHRTYVTPTTFIDALLPTEPLSADDPKANFDLIIHNPHLGGLCQIAIAGREIGEARPNAIITLRNVPAGTYEVSFRTHTGLERTRRLHTQLQHGSRRDRSALSNDNDAVTNDP